MRDYEHFMREVNRSSVYELHHEKIVRELTELATVMAEDVGDDDDLVKLLRDAAGMIASLTGRESMRYKL